jgi:hypothetical protein
VALVVVVVILVQEQQQAVLVTHPQQVHRRVITVAVMQDLLAHLFPQLAAAVQAQQVEAHHLIL